MLPPVEIYPLGCSLETQLGNIEQVDVETLRSPIRNSFTLEQEVGESKMLQSAEFIHERAILDIDEKICRLSFPAEVSEVDDAHLKGISFFRCIIPQILKLARCNLSRRRIDIFDNYSGRSRLCRRPATPSLFDRASG